MKLPRWRLFPKYATLIIAVVAGVLVISGAINLVFSWREIQSHLVSLQMEKAQGAATRIEQFVLDIEHQIGWTAFIRTDPSIDPIEQRRLDYLKLLKQVPAITELVWITPDGREGLRESRLALSTTGAGTDLSKEPAFIAARASKTWFGPVQFRKGTEPYMAIARPAGGDGGVTVADVNLKFVWDVVSRIKIGQNGLAYVVDATGTLIAHPDISLVLKKTDMKALPQVAALDQPDRAGFVSAHDLSGAEVFAAHARIPTLNWTVFVETPRAEALAPLNEAIVRLVLLLAGGLLLAAAESFVLARALVRPISALQQGAERIGAGDLDQRIEIKSGDELEGLAEQFNRMGDALQASYAGLERKVDERTAELTESLEYQTATSDVLRVISSSTTDVTPVFEAIMDSAMRLFACPISAVFRYDGRLVHLVATRNWPEAAIADARRLYPAPPNPNMLSGRVIVSGQAMVLEDTHADPAYDPVTAHVGNWRRMIGAPMLKDGVAVGALVVAWPDPGKTPQRQCELLKTFADQAVIAIENVRLINETKEALEQQTATAEILKVISASPTDVQPVFDAIVASCQRLCGGKSVNLLLARGGMLERVASASEGDVTGGANVQRWPLDDQSVSGDCVLRSVVVSVPDRDAVFEDYPRTRELATSIGWRSAVFVPLLREGKAIGCIGILRSVPGPFDTKEVSLAQVFADQAVIAIENVRLLNETKEALEQQTAIADVMRVMSASVADSSRAFNAIVRSAEGLFAGAQVGIELIRDDGQLELAAHSQGMDAGLLREYPKALANTPTERAIRERSGLHMDDILHDGDYRAAHPDADPNSSYAIGLAPMLWEGRGIGAVFITQSPPRAFTRQQLLLLLTFADQAVIAIQNARLFNETKEALEQQTATAEVLQVISGSVADAQPVFEKILRSCQTLFGGEYLGTVLVGDDGQLRLAAALGGGGALHEREFMRPLAGSATELAIRERRVLNYADAANAPDMPQTLRQLCQRQNIRSLLMAPMMWEDRGVGSIWVGRSKAWAFSEKEEKLMRTFADQAVIAIQNARLFNETKEALEQQTATAEVLRVISSSVADTAPVFEKILESCRHLFESSEQGIVLMGDDGRLHLGAHRGSARDKLAAIFPIASGGDEPVARAMAEQRVLHYADVLRDAEPRSLSRVVAERLGVGSYTQVFAPMRWEGEGVGYLYVIRSPVTPFSDKEIGLLKTFADQAAIAIQNARLFHEIEDKSRQLEAANRHKSEFLANMSHELRTPLNAIIGFSEVLVEKMFGEVNDKQMEYLQDIHSSGQHLLMLINDVLDLSKIEAGKMELDLSCFDLGLLLEHSATLVRERAQRHGLTLELEVGDGLAEWVADARKVKQVAVNLLSNAVKFTPNGGRVSVRARHLNGVNGRAGEWAEVSVSDTGVGIAPADQALVFEEFRQASGDVLRKAEGTGLGLALVKRFVELHGGTVTLESAPGRGSTFRFMLPQHEVKVLQ